MTNHSSTRYNDDQSQFIFILQQPVYSTTDRRTNRRQYCTKSRSTVRSTTALKTWQRNVKAWVGIYVKHERKMWNKREQCEHKGENVKRERGEMWNMTEKCESMGRNICETWEKNVKHEKSKMWNVKEKCETTTHSSHIALLREFSRHPRRCFSASGAGQFADEDASPAAGYNTPGLHNTPCFTIHLASQHTRLHTVQASQHTMFHNRSTLLQAWQDTQLHKVRWHVFMASNAYQEWDIHWFIYYI